MAATVLIVAFIGLLAYGIALSSPDETLDQRLAAGEAARAPGFELPVLSRGSASASGASRLRTALADDRLALTELRGLPVVVNFWASWCPPCSKETPVLERAWRSARDRGVVFVGLNMQDVTGDARDFLAELRVSYPNVRDRSDEVAREWGLTGLPETYFVNRNGEVVGHVVGTVSKKQLDEGVRASVSGDPLRSREGGDRRGLR